MNSNILSTLTADQIVRVSIDNIPESLNVNSAIGRTAHIMYLENPLIVNQLIMTLKPFLQYNR